MEVVFNKVNINTINVILLSYSTSQLSLLLYTINIWRSRSYIFLIQPVPLTSGSSGKYPGSMWHLRDVFQHSWNVCRVESLEASVAFTGCGLRVHDSFSLNFPSSQVPITVDREYLVGGVKRSLGKDGIPGDWDEGNLLTEAIWWLLGFDMF